MVEFKEFSITSIQFNKTTDGNLFNSNLKGELTITGLITGEHNSIPKIKNFHISERFEMRNDEQICIVVISPVVVYNPNTSLISELQPIPFKHTIPISIQS